MLHLFAIVKGAVIFPPSTIAQNIAYAVLYVNKIASV
jgi:hypothetical protein